MFMEMAIAVAKRSTCYRLNVGAIVVANNRAVSVGYNGSPPGAPHCRGHECPGKHHCHETIHAEINALAYIPRGVIADDMYVTDSPCSACAKAIRESGISRLFFQKPYRITDGLDLLMSNGVPCYQVSPAGYIVDWSTGELIDASVL